MQIEGHMEDESYTFSHTVHIVQYLRRQPTLDSTIFICGGRTGIE